MKASDLVWSAASIIIGMPGFVQANPRLQLPSGGESPPPPPFSQQWLPVGSQRTSGRIPSPPPLPASWLRRPLERRAAFFFASPEDPFSSMRRSFQGLTSNVERSMKSVMNLLGQEMDKISSGLTGRSPRLITAPLVSPPTGEQPIHAAAPAVAGASAGGHELQPVAYGPTPPPEPIIDFSSCNCKFGKLGEHNEVVHFEPYVDPASLPAITEEVYSVPSYSSGSAVPQDTSSNVLIVPLQIQETFSTPTDSYSSQVAVPVVQQAASHSSLPALAVLPADIGSYSSPAAAPSQTADSYSLQATAPLQPADTYGLPAAEPVQPADTYGLPAAEPVQPADTYGLPAAEPLQPADNYGLPAAEPVKPANTYGLPAAEPVQPADTYGLPAASPITNEASQSDPQLESGGSSVPLIDNTLAEYDTPLEDLPLPIYKEAHRRPKVVNKYINKVVDLGVTTIVDRPSSQALDQEAPEKYLNSDPSLLHQLMEDALWYSDTQRIKAKLKAQKKIPPKSSRWET